MTASNAKNRVDWGSAFIAGMAATVAMTVVMALMGMNIMKSLGMMFLGPGSGTMSQYIVGGLVHFSIGIVYGFIYAVIFAPIGSWNRFLKAGVFGFAITAAAMAFMPVLGSMMSGGADNPCNPCYQGSGAHSATMNPCNPCGDMKAKIPKNPCGETKAMNPCNPYGDVKPMNPCNHTSAMKAGNPCNPCAGGANPFAGLFNLINHLIYAFVLAFVYKGSKSLT